MMEIKNERVGRECWREEEGRSERRVVDCRRILVAIVVVVCWLVVVVGLLSSGGQEVERWKGGKVVDGGLRGVLGDGMISPQRAQKKMEGRRASWWCKYLLLIFLVHVPVVRAHAITRGAGGDGDRDGCC